MVSDAHHITPRHSPCINHRFHHGPDFLRAVAHQNAIVALPCDETVFVFAGDRFVIGVGLADDTAGSAGHYVVHKHIHISIGHENHLFAGFSDDVPELFITGEDMFAHPRGANDGARGDDNVVVTDHEVDGETGEDAEHAAIDFSELFHDPFEFRFHAKLEEIFVAECEEGPHEHGVIEIGGGGRTGGCLVAPFGGVMRTVKAKQGFFVAVVPVFEYGPVGEIALFEGAELQDGFAGREPMGSDFLLPVSAVGVAPTAFALIGLVFRTGLGIIGRGDSEAELGIEFVHPDTAEARMVVVVDPGNPGFRVGVRPMFPVGDSFRAKAHITFINWIRH